MATELEEMLRQTQTLREHLRTTSDRTEAYRDQLLRYSERSAGGYVVRNDKNIAGTTD